MTQPTTYLDQLASAAAPGTSFNAPGSAPFGPHIDEIRPRTAVRTADGGFEIPTLGGKYDVVAHIHA